MHKWRSIWILRALIVLYGVELVANETPDIEEFGNPLREAFVLESLSVAAQDRNVWVGEEEGVLKFALEDARAVLDVRLRIRECEKRVLDDSSDLPKWELVSRTTDDKARTVELWPQHEDAAWMVGIRAGNSAKGVCWELQSREGLGMKGFGGKLLSCSLQVEAELGAMTVEAVAVSKSGSEVVLGSQTLFLQQARPASSVAGRGAGDGSSEAEGEWQWERRAAACSAGCADWEAYLERSIQQRRQAAEQAGGERWWEHRPEAAEREAEEEEEEEWRGLGGVTVTLVVAAVNANRPRHYNAGDSSFSGDYLWSLKQVLGLKVPVVVYLQAGHEGEVAGAAHELSRIVPVGNMTEEFPHWGVWDCAYRACLQQGTRPDGCANPTLFPWQQRVSLIWLSKLYWLHAVAQQNPFGTSHFLWLDVGRCPHLLHPPLDFTFLRRAVDNDQFAIFGAWDKLTPCFGGLSRRRRRGDLGRDPSEILRAQLMGGSAGAVARVLEEYERELLEGLRGGEVYDKEEPLLTTVWDRHGALFAAEATYRNVLGQNMEIITCWSIRQMSNTMPKLRVLQPPHKTQLAPEDNLFLLALEHVHVHGRGRAMMLGGHWHAYATPNNQEIEICYRVVPGDEEGQAARWGGARMDEEEEATGQHAFGTRVISESANIWCLDAIPARPLLDLDPGPYTLFAYISKKSSGDPISASVLSRFSVVPALPPAHATPPPTEWGEAESRWDLLEGGWRGSAGGRAAVVVVGCGGGGGGRGGNARELAEGAAEDPALAVTCVRPVPTCAGEARELTGGGGGRLCSSCEEGLPAESACGRECGAGEEEGCCQVRGGARCLEEGERVVGEARLGGGGGLLVYLQAGEEAVSDYAEGVMGWRGAVERRGGVLAGSHYFSRSSAYASILHAQAEMGEEADFVDGYVHVFGEVGREGHGVRDHGALRARLAGVKGEVDDALAGRGSALGATLEPVERSWFWLP